MKKFLSIILACAMIMSLFCVVPASAAVATSAYVFEDFEAGSAFISSVTRTNAEGTVYEGAYSAKQITVPIAAGETSHNYDSTHDIICSADYAKTFLPGDQIKVTFKYKLTYPLAEGSVFSVVANGKKSDGNWLFPAVNGVIADADNTTDWQTFEATLDYPTNVVNRDTTGSAPYYASLLYIRMSSGSNGPLTVAEAPEEATKVGIYLDNVEITKVVDQGEPVVEKYDGSRTDFNIYGNSYGKAVNYDVADPFDAESDNVVYKLDMTGANGASNCNIGYFYMDFAGVTLSPNDKATISFKLAIDEANDTTTVADYCHIKFSTSNPASTYPTATGMSLGSGKTFKPKHNGVEGWQEFAYEFTYTGESAAVIESARIGIADGTTGNSIYKESNIYVDDIEIVLTPNPAACKTPVVTGLTAEADADGIVTAPYTFTKGAGDATGTDASVYKLLNAQGGVVGSGLVSAGITIPEGVTATQLQIVPVTSTGYIGEVVTCAIEEAEEEVEPIVGTYFTNLAGNLTLSSGTAIENAKIIFVTYDANGKMVDFDVVSDVDVAVNGTINVAPTKVLNAGTKSVVMLWQDMIKCVPLADALAY